MVQGVQFRRGTTAQHSVFTGQPGEITVDTDKKVVVVHDGSAVGGYEVVGAGTTQRITNKDVNATSLNVTGVSTIPIIRAIHLSASGVSSVTQLTVSGVTSVGFITSKNLYVSGVSTFSGSLIPDSTNVILGSVSKSFGGAYFSDGELYFGNNKLLRSSPTEFGLAAYASNAAYLKSNAGGGSAGDVYMDTVLGGKVIAFGSGAVNLLHSQFKKLETTTIGITVTGTTQTTNLNVGTGGTVISTTSSGLVGIGTTSPADTLTVLGKIHIHQDSGSNSRIILRGQPGSLYRWNIDNYSSANQFRIFKEDDGTAANGAVAIQIDQTGNTLISGITTTTLGSSSSPPNNSQMSFALTSNTNLRISVRGTDGVLRTANITLA